MADKRKFIMICGLPGSGKTFLANEIAKNYNVLLYDDLPISFDVNSFGLLGGGSTIVISDQSLCVPKNRIVAAETIGSFHELEWIFFENDPEKCWRNIRRRNDGRFISQFALQQMSLRYVIPFNVKPLPVFQP